MSIVLNSGFNIGSTFEYTLTEDIYFGFILVAYSSNYVFIPFRSFRGDTQTVYNNISQYNYISVTMPSYGKIVISYTGSSQAELYFRVHIFKITP